MCRTSRIIHLVNTFMIFPMKIGESSLLRHFYITGSSFFILERPGITIFIFYHRFCESLTSCLYPLIFLLSLFLFWPHSVWVILGGFRCFPFYFLFFFLDAHFSVSGFRSSRYPHLPSFTDSFIHLFNQSLIRLKIYPESTVTRQKQLESHS